GGPALATGGTFTTPALTASRQYFVEATTGSAETVGRPVPAATTSATASTYGLVFTATSSFTLTSVDVYPASTAGNLVVQVQDNTGTLIPGLAATVAVPAGTGTTAFTVPLNFNVPAGTGLRLVAISSPSLVREGSVGGFPYTSPSGAVSITNGYITGTSTTYYYFYNWQVSTACAGPRTAIQVNVNPAPAQPTLTATYNGTTTTLTSSAATGNQFYFNGVAIAGATGQTYVVNGAATTYGSYTVVVTNSAGCSSPASVATVVTTTRAGIAGASLRVYPNPTPTGQVTLELSGFRSATQLAVIDALGRLVRSEMLPATTGVITHQLNLAGTAPGVYMLRLTNADGVETRRLIRE
ncbi:MAG: T9SS type A sorting domain-containing protein, partial [Cytophagaceae bacterium]